MPIGRVALLVAILPTASRPLAKRQSLLFKIAMLEHGYPPVLIWNVAVSGQFTSQNRRLRGDKSVYSFCLLYGPPFPCFFVGWEVMMARREALDESSEQLLPQILK